MNRSPDTSSHADDRLAIREYGLVLVQLVVLTVLVWQFHLEENRHLPVAMMLGTGGFAVHALLPARYRIAAFIALCLGGLVLLLGLSEAATLTGLAAALIAIAVLPIAWVIRAGLLLAAAAVLVGLRHESPAMFWPILGSMFMFRLLVYMQSEKRRRASLQDTAAYFLMWPNIFFPLFPVVDFRTFQESYYNAEPRCIYQKGIHWLATGLAHLTLYRFIKYEWLPSPLEIRTLTDIAIFLSTNYALYLRISGHFHVICGLLHLFGFNLPRTHDLYFLAFSFSDIWRRINLYWKDFMMKSFFFPAYFRARRWGDLAGIFLAVMWVFLWTWLAHSWQVFWLIDVFPFRASDAALWLGVGTLVAVNSLIDYRRATRTPPAPLTVPRAIGRGFQTLAVFLCVSLFWAYWGNPDVFRMLIALTSVAVVTTNEVLMLALLVLVFVAVATVAHLQAAGRNTAAAMPFDRSVALHLIALSAALIIGQRPVYEQLGGQAARIIADLQVEKMNRGEALAIIDGYYEELNDRSLQSGPFLGQEASRTPGPAVDFGDMIQYRDDLLEHELIPNWKGEWSGATIRVNRWGMRDRDRSIVKPAATVRIAMVGSSLVMGFGVNDEQTFSRVLEDRLNSQAETAGARYEVLNFGVGRYSPLHRRLQIEHKVLAFNPDLIVYFAHQDELYSSSARIAPAYFHGIDLEDACLDAIVGQSGIREDTSAAMMEIMLAEHHAEILRCVYDRMADASQSARVDLIYVYLPIPGQHDLPFDPRMCLPFANQAGIETVDLSNWEGKHPLDEVMLRPGDHHPNAFGHRLLADKLEPILLERLAKQGR